MERDITLKVEIFSDDGDEKHCITSSKEILFTLREMVDKKSRVALYYGEDNHFILTTFLAVDAQNLWLEQYPDSLVNTTISSEDQLIVVGSHYKVKIQFGVTRPTLTDYQGTPAFVVSTPNKLFRLQRREYFRLMTPVTNPLKCAIPIHHEAKDASREVTIMDISSGGIALTCAESDTELQPGECYSGCSIDLPGFGTIVGTIMVRNLAVLSDATEKSYKRAGCELISMDNASLALLQRYVMHLQLVK